MSIHALITNSPFDPPETLTRDLELSILLEDMLAALEATEEEYDPETDRGRLSCPECSRGLSRARVTCTHHMRVKAIARARKALGLGC